jgi:hypothetical protein
MTAEPFEILGSTIRAELHILGGTFVIERRRRRRRSRAGLPGLRWAIARS